LRGVWNTRLVIHRGRISGSTSVHKHNWNWPNVQRSSIYLSYIDVMK
jgi:hypothetical protein